MPGIIHSDSAADLRRAPAAASITAAAADQESTIGDTHGNFMKLLYFYMREGIVTAKPPNTLDDIYQAFRTIDDRPTEIMREDILQRFRFLLTQLRFNSIAKARLIGDVLADRGSNDYFTLLFLDYIRRQGINTEIILSNHDGEFIRSMIAGSSESVIAGPQSASMGNLQKLIDKGLTSAAEVRRIWRNTYLPSLKPFSYNIEANPDGSLRFTLISHAPIGLETVRAAAERLGLTYHDDDAYALADTIDAINDRFQQLMAAGDYSCLDLDKKALEGYLGSTAIDPRYPFLRAMWNRAGKARFHIDGAGNADSDGTIDIIELPAEHNGYQLCSVFGHEGQDNDATAAARPANQTNIDTNLGKRRSEAKNDVGLYVCYAQTKSANYGATPQAVLAELREAINSAAVDRDDAEPESSTAAADTDDMAQPLLAEPAAPRHRPVIPLDRGQAKRASARCEQAIMALCHNPHITQSPGIYRRLLAEMNKVRIDNQLTLLAIKGQIQAQLMAAEHLQLARLGDHRHHNALWYYQWFEAFVREKIGDAAYDSADGHEAYNLHAMNAIITETNALGAERNLTDIIAAVDSLYNIYQRMTDDRRHWWRLNQERPPANGAGRTLPYAKPIFLHRDRLPKKHRTAHMVVRQKIRVRIERLQHTARQSFGWNLAKRIRRGWNNLFRKKVAARKIPIGKASAAECATAVREHLLGRCGPKKAIDIAQRTKKELVDRPTPIQHPWAKHFKYQLNLLEKAQLLGILATQAIDIGITEASTHVTYHQMMQLLLHLKNHPDTTTGADILAITQMTSGVARSLYITMAKQNPKMLHAFLQAFTNPNSGIIIDKANELLLGLYDIGEEGPQYAAVALENELNPIPGMTGKGECNRFIPCAGGGYDFVRAKRFRRIPTAVVATRGEHAWDLPGGDDADEYNPEVMYTVVAGHIDKNGNITLDNAHCRAGDSTLGDTWVDDMHLAAKYSPPTMRAPVIPVEPEPEHAVAATAERRSDPMPHRQWGRPSRPSATRAAAATGTFGTASTTRRCGRSSRLGRGSAAATCSAGGKSRHPLDDRPLRSITTAELEDALHHPDRYELKQDSVRDELQHRQREQAASAALAAQLSRI